MSLNSGDRIPGFLAQSMGGPKVVPVECAQYIVPGSYTFTTPRSGLYKFVAQGPGAACFNAGTGGGGAGGYGEVTKSLAAGQTVAIVVSPGCNLTGSPTTLTFPDGTVCTANSGSGCNSNGVGGAGGTATGFDVNLTGGAGGNASSAGAPGPGTSGGAGGAPSGGNGGGGGAPANKPYLGAPGQAGGQANKWNGGAGACAASVNTFGGDGYCFVQCVKGL